MRTTAKFKDAKPHLEKAMSIEPDNAEYQAEMALMLAFQASMRVNAGLKVHPSLLDQAVSHAKKSFKQNTKSHFAHTAMGIVCDIRKRHVKARKYFSEAGRRGNRWWQINTCTSYYMEGLGGEALQSVEAFIEANGEPHWLVYLWHGRALFLCGRYHDAEIEFRKAIRASRPYPGVAQAVSNSLYMQGNISGAAKYLFKEAAVLSTLNWRRALRLVVQGYVYGRMDALCHLSKSLYRKYGRNKTITRILMRSFPPYEPESTLSERAFVMGHADAAAALLNRAMPYAQNEARLWANRCAICAALGEMASAQAAIERACELEPNIQEWQLGKKSMLAVIEGGVRPRFYSSHRSKSITEVSEADEIIFKP